MQALISLSLPLTEVWSLTFLAILFQYLLQSANYMPGTELYTRDSKENKGRILPMKNTALVNISQIELVL